MSLKSKLFTSAVAFTMVLGLVAVPVSAQTTAELNAQIAQLMAMINQLQGQVAGAPAATAGASMVFTTDLTVGSTGADVVALQQYLVSRGDLVMPAGVAMGYFGSLTKAAVAKFQVANGITPAVGYFGPITRAKVNAMAVTTGGTTGTVNCPAGYTCTATGGTTTGGTTGVGITTPGVEGTLTVTNSAAGLASTAYEGNSKVAVLGFKAEAKTSDIALQRVKINLNDSSKVYNAVYSKMYLTDADGNVLASSDLNSSTVVKEGSTYFITLTGFNYVVPKNTIKQLYIKADLYSNIDSTDITNYNATYNTLTLADNGVRGVDGAGIDQYSPSTGSNVTHAVTIAATLTDSATLKVSLDSASPVKQDVVAADGSANNELDKMPVLVFDLKAEKDNVLVTSMQVAVRKTSGNATANTAYLYDGSTEIDNATVTSGVATFSNDFTVNKDTTKVLTVKVDVRSADGTVTPFVATASTTLAANLVAENSAGDSVTLSGSATGNTIGVRNVGPEITLLSKSITTSGTPQEGTSGSTTISTSTLSASFTFRVKAVGGDIVLGTIASNTPFFASSTPTNGAKSFTVYKNGVAITTLGSAATSTSYSIPSTCVTISGANSCTLSEGNSVDIPVTVTLQGRSTQAGAFDPGLYSVGVSSLNWNATNSTFMSGENDWKTVDVSFP